MSVTPAVTTSHRRRPGRVAAASLAVLGAACAGLATAGPVTAAKPVAPAAAPTPPSVPLGSMYAVAQQIGAHDLWARGYTGAGVNVALIDTGVAPVDALADRVVAVVDLSAEAHVPEAAFVDTFGHGTHLAGIIAGHEPGADPALAADHPEWFLGVAPDAGLVSVKVADNAGAVDVTQVVAGIDWVVEHATELDIRVLELAYSSGSTLPYETDPVTAALERAWRAGIVVVVAAGNDGKGSHELASPADDPYVISVAAVEATSATRFKVPRWASSGDGTRNPDVAAPGAHIESLRVPNSRIDLEHPEGYVDDTTFRGSGSSQASAVVAGAAALLLEARPDLTPDQVKALLATDTRTASPASERFSGAGVVQLGSLVDASVGDATQTWPTSDGSGSLDAARGGHHVVIDGVPLVGDVTVLGTPWEGQRWAGQRWAGGEWNGQRWAAGEWMGQRWASSAWTGQRWAGQRWADETWSGQRWAGQRWADASWTGARWTGQRWADDSWTGAIWTGQRWAGQRWAGTAWSGWWTTD